MSQNVRGELFEQWLEDLPQLVIRSIGVQESKISKDVEKELKYLIDRREKVIEEIRTEYNVATNSGVLLIRPTTFPWINDFIAAAEDILLYNPRGGIYLSPLAEDLIALSTAQLMLARESKNKFAEREWYDLTNRLQILKYNLDRS